MIAFYSIDWASLYSHWFVSYTDEALNAAAVNEFVLLLRGVRRKVQRNGILFCDKRNESRRGLSMILRALTGVQGMMGTDVAPTGDEGALLAAWGRLSDELKLYKRYYESPEYCIRVDAQSANGEFLDVQRSFDDYLRTTRLSRKAYKYPAVVISESNVGMTNEAGFTWVTLRDFEGCSEDDIGEKWAEGVHIKSGCRQEADRLFAALSVASGAGDRTIQIVDPILSGKVLVCPPDAAWVKSVAYLLRFFAVNPNVKTIGLISADEIALKRTYTFGPLIVLLKESCSNARQEDLRAYVGLRDDSWKCQGRKLFHNRYLVVGRFLIAAPNGLDVTDDHGMIRGFDLVLTSRQNDVVDQILDTNGDNVIRARNIVNLVKDHQECLKYDGSGELAEFKFSDGRMMESNGTGDGDGH